MLSRVVSLMRGALAATFCFFTFNQHPWTCLFPYSSSFSRCAFLVLIRPALDWEDLSCRTVGFLAHPVSHG